MDAATIRAGFDARMRALAANAQDIAGADPYENGAAAFRVAMRDLKQDATDIRDHARALLDASVDDELRTYLLDVDRRACGVIALAAREVIHGPC